jgi:hypothetical protein
MILYHFTGPWLREPILSGGLDPFKRSDAVDSALHSPLPPCVWLTTDPEMPDDHSSANGLRITIDIPDDDPQLRHWPTYLREQAKDETKDTLEEVIASDEPMDSFYCYFGTIPPEWFKADDDV